MLLFSRKFFEALPFCLLRTSRLRVRLKKDAAKYNKNFKVLVFTQGGPSDIAYNNCKETLKLFDDAGIKYEYNEVPGGHSWTAWRQNLYDLAPRLFK